jgi:hypothetical protein
MGGVGSGVPSSLPCPCRRTALPPFWRLPPFPGQAPPPQSALWGILRSLAGVLERSGQATLRPAGHPRLALCGWDAGPLTGTRLGRPKLGQNWDERRGEKEKRGRAEKAVFPRNMALFLIRNPVLCPTELLA